MSDVRALATLGLAFVVSLALIGCGGDSDEPAPQGPLARALSEIGGGGENGSLGIGWTDPRLAAQRGIGAPLMATALGPNAGTVVEAAAELRRRFGFDPLEAETLISVGGSYAFGLRLDGVAAARLQRALIRAGGREVGSGAPQLVDVGGYAVVPGPLLRAGVLGLGARDAFGSAQTVLAISETSRDTLLGRGDRVIEQPIYRATADCLGDVAAARLIPERHLLSVEVGIDLVAVGVARDREVLCVLGGTAGRAAQIAAALRGSLAPDAREPRTGERMGDLVRVAGVETRSSEGVEVVRAELIPAAGRPPGFLFDAIGRGSLLQLINGP